MEPYSSPTILLVNDDEHFLAIFAALLEGRGFSIIQADSGRKALELAEPLAGFIDVVISDLIMDGMNGIQLVDSLHRLQPKLPVIFLSGWELYEVLPKLVGSRILTYPHEHVDIGSPNRLEKIDNLVRKFLQGGTKDE